MPLDRIAGICHSREWGESTASWIVALLSIGRRDAMSKTWMLAATLVLTLGACGGGGVPETNGEACLDFGSAVCGRLGECNDEVDVGACETQFYGGCCANANTCDDEIDPEDAPSDDEYDTCLGDIDDLACPQIENGELPASCDDIDDGPDDGPAPGQ
jgi:hypothetical protein